MGYSVFNDFTVIYSTGETYPRIEKNKNKICFNFDLIPYFEIAPINGYIEYVWLTIEGCTRYAIKKSDLPLNLQF